MTDLAKWMKKYGARDRLVAAQTGTFISEINRFRHGPVGADRRNAAKLERLTGLEWWRFTDSAPKTSKRVGES